MTSITERAITHFGSLAGQSKGIMNIDNLLCELHEASKPPTEKYNVKYRKNSRNQVINVSTDEFFNELTQKRTTTDIFSVLREYNIPLVSFYPNSTYIEYSNLRRPAIELYRECMYVCDAENSQVLWQIIPESQYEKHYKTEWE